MKVQLAAAYNGHVTIERHLVEVSSLMGASRAVRDFIDAHDLTAGCGISNAFEGGEVYIDGEMIAKVSYNGRVWDLENKEIVV